MLSCLTCLEGSVHCILGNSWQVGNNSLSFLLVTVIITQIIKKHTHTHITISHSVMVETFYWLLLFLYWVNDIFTVSSYLVCLLSHFSHGHYCWATQCWLFQILASFCAHFVLTMVLTNLSHRVQHQPQKDSFSHSYPIVWHNKKSGLSKEPHIPHLHLWQCYPHDNSNSLLKLL